jgi:hypothetical protein
MDLFAVLMTCSLNLLLLVFLAAPRLLVRSFLPPSQPFSLLVHLLLLLSSLGGCPPGWSWWRPGARTWWTSYRCMGEQYYCYCVIVVQEVVQGIAWGVGERGGGSKGDPLCWVHAVVVAEA